jgi:hypothetical protein
MTSSKSSHFLSGKLLSMCSVRWSTCSSRGWRPVLTQDLRRMGSTPKSPPPSSIKYGSRFAIQQKPVVQHRPLRPPPLICNTKIICTLGPASSSEAVLATMIKAGMNVARLNFSHGTHQEHEERMRLVRRISKSLNKHVAILVSSKLCDMSPAFQK